MKNIIKKINIVGLVALFVAGGMALAFNAPQQVSAHTYGQLEDGTWVEPNSNLYFCDFSDDVCMASFESATPPPQGSKDWVLIEEDGIYKPRP